MYVCSPSEGRDVPVGQWLNAHEGTRQPNIISATGEDTHGLREFLLRMLSYFPADRPQIMEVCEYIRQIIETTGGSLRTISHDIDHPELSGCITTLTVRNGGCKLLCSKP